MKTTYFENFKYNKNLQSFANDLRKKMTKSECCLWKYALKAGKMRGYNFRRQRPILNYIVDFFCKELKLIIEVDGITHEIEDIIKNDEKRDTKLKEAGFYILRIYDEEVLENIEQVIKFIEITIEKLENVHPLPPPAGESGKFQSAVTRKQDFGYNF